LAKATFDPSRATTPVETSFEVRLAVRALQRALEATAPTGRELLIDRFGRWFEIPGQPRSTSLTHREQLRRLFLKLADERRTTPGRPVPPRELQAVAWPGERMLVDAGANRVRVGINALRALGLRSVVLTRGGGYFIDPAVMVTPVDTEINLA